MFIRTTSVGAELQGESVSTEAAGGPGGESAEGGRRRLGGTGWGCPGAGWPARRKRRGEEVGGVEGEEPG